MKVALDIQHLYKASQPKDKGAFAHGIHEADIVKDYMEKTAFLLKEKGITVLLNDPEKNTFIGDYWQRHIYANNNGVHLYIAGHLNIDSTQSEYSFIEYNKETHYENAIFSHILSSNLKNYLNTDNIIIKTLNKSDPDYYCIDNLLMPAIIYKPLSIYNNSHMKLTKNLGLFVIAEALVNAILQYQEADLGI